MRVQAHYGTGYWGFTREGCPESLPDTHGPWRAWKLLNVAPNDDGSIKPEDEQILSDIASQDYHLKKMPNA